MLIQNNRFVYFGYPKKLHGVVRRLELGTIISRIANKSLLRRRLGDRGKYRHCFASNCGYRASRRAAVDLFGAGTIFPTSAFGRWLLLAFDADRAQVPLLELNRERVGLTGDRFINFFFHGACARDLGLRFFRSNAKVSPTLDG